jgi:hypothetical protein
MKDITVPKFYCKQYSGDSDFSIDEWNEKYDMTKEMNLSDEESGKILFPEIYSPCTEQCFDCMGIVGKQREKTKNFKQ